MVVVRDMRSRDETRVPQADLVETVKRRLV